MNLELAHTMLRQYRYCLEMREVKKKQRAFCIVYANNGYQAHRLCNMSKLALIGTQKFSRMIEPLGKRQA